jgi:4-hydroxybenzoate polyprenyltransferase
MAPGAVAVPVYLLGYLALFAMETATVLVNEHADYSTDRANRNFSAFNGGSRVLVTGRLQRREVLGGAAIGVAAALLAAWSAIAASAGSTTALLIVVVILLVLTLGYTAPPLKLAYRGLGELVVAAVHSFGVIAWGYLLQDGDLGSPLPWTTATPLALAVLAAILLAGIPDHDADRLAGKRTIAVRRGMHQAALLALIAVWLAAASAILLEAAALLPPLGAARYALLGHALLLSFLIRRHLQEQGGSRRINGLLAATLAYGAWFGVVPLLTLAFG